MLRNRQRTYVWTYAVLLLLCCVRFAAPWSPFAYDTTWSLHATDQASKEATWTSDSYWGNVTADGWVNPNRAPRPRRGHSLVAFKSPANSIQYYGKSLIVMFGGRDNDALAPHIPKTYNVTKVNGTFKFTTYKDRPINPCFDFEGIYYLESERKKLCSVKGANNSLVNIGSYYNDVWAYVLCEKGVYSNTSTAKRYWDSPCVDGGWVNLHAGAREGGCVIQLGVLVCSVPSERFMHTAVAFDDGCMYVYGGFSQRCRDYCNDMWFFDLFLTDWRQLFAPNSREPNYDLSHLYTYEVDIFTYTYTQSEVPVDNSTKRNAGPGRRWKHSASLGAAYVDSEGATRQKMYVFGGHRLWQGYAEGNSYENNWEDYETIPAGGYLDDIWIYTKKLDLITTPGETFKSAEGKWNTIKAKQRCFASPGQSYATRDDFTCETVWPPHRAGHGGKYDSSRNVLWVFGGYHTYYPYLSTDGEGSGDSTSSVGSGGFVPYPSYDYYLSDLWCYNFSTGYWRKIEKPDSVLDADWIEPAGRTEMVFELVGQADEFLVMHAGFADNHYFQDMWFFDIENGIWIEKKTFVYPKYTASCTDDLEYIRSHKDCVHLNWTLPLERNATAPFNILPYDWGEPGSGVSGQRFYWPDQSNGPYWNIQQIDFHKGEHALVYSDTPQIGTPEFPFAATGPMQWAKPFHYAFSSTQNFTLYEYCVSVVAETTRHLSDEDLVAQGNKTRVFISQARRKRPGWDGCRDRLDGRDDLPQELQWLVPSPRAGHRAAYFKDTNELFMYGGSGYDSEYPKRTNLSWPFKALDDMWLYGFDNCINNCSFHGDCYFGFCQCDPGFYGVDCSNKSCPGTFCEYTSDLMQTCVHACSVGYKHGPNDTYVQDINKLPCVAGNRDLWEINGVCDGFGKSMCAPPMIGDDCSIKDCKANCSFNGYCSVEYPVSRCMCQPSYFGEICEFKTCLNNCSYPNGQCNTTSGSCNCNMMYNPFNNSQPYHPWDGEDCSYLFAYSAAARRADPFMWANIAMLVLLGATAVAVYSDSSSDEHSNSNSNSNNNSSSDSGGGGGRSDQSGSKAYAFSERPLHEVRSSAAVRLR